MAHQHSIPIIEHSPSTHALKDCELTQIKTLPPGSVIGILGGGQLGQMMSQAAHQLGYRVCVYDRVADGPASFVAHEMMVGSFEDQEALGRFAQKADVITLEFENIPVSALQTLSLKKPVYPGPGVIAICQDRILEKEFLRTHGFPLAPYEIIESAADLKKALLHFNAPCILKTATLGYDGKGQYHLKPGDDTLLAWEMLQTTRAVLEKKISFTLEASLITARSLQGDMATFPLQENIHRDGILDVSITSPSSSDSLAAEKLGKAVAEAIGVVGLMTIEFFLLPNGNLLINELAPRPHNSGHHTLESSQTSQFEQAIRAVVGLPLGSTELVHEAVMVNLMGELWEYGEPRWEALQGAAHVYLHLYQKKEAKKGRKMGHFTIVGEDRVTLLHDARKIFENLRKDSH